MSKQDVCLRKILHICSGIYILTVLYGFYVNTQLQDYNALAMGAVACITPLLVPLLFRICRFKPVYEIYIINIIFVYFASLIGSSFHGYSIVGFDKVLHFSSGLMFTIVGMLLFMILKKVKHITNKEDYAIFLIFMNAINITVAAIWEFYEYSLLILFDNDCINHYSQGVHDAMSDMICAFVAGLIITYIVMRAYKHNKPNFIINLCEKFYSLNVEPRL